MKGTKIRLALAVLVVLALGVFVAACGSSSSGSSSSSSSTGEGTTASAKGDGSAEEDISEEGGKASAEKVIAPYLGQPSAFPVTQELKEVPKGATVAYMDCGTPICAVFWQILGPAAQTMGVNIERIKAGSAANTISAAFDTVVAKKPDAVIVAAINVELWKNQLKELQAANIPVVTVGVTGTEPYGIAAPQSGEAANAKAGELMAAYVAAKMHPEADVVVYKVPELPLTIEITEAFESDISTFCTGCSVRVVDIPIATIGNTAPQTVVSDLQANPDTNVAVFTSEEVETGLPVALKTAGIEIETLGYAPGPSGLQSLKEGKETADLAVDLPVTGWTLLDLAARDLAGQKIAPVEAEGIPVSQFLTPPDITFDPAKGWTGYPDFVERFSKLWGVAG